MKTNVTFNNVREKFIHHAALAFFASAYADLHDEAGEPLSGEILDQLQDEIDPAAIHAAKILLMSLESENNWIEQLMYDIENMAEGDRPATPEHFGHYAAMQAMGHGVGLYDAFGGSVYHAITVPYMEFGSYSLEKDYI